MSKRPHQQAREQLSGEVPNFISFGIPEAELYPDMFGLYPGYDVDTFLLQHQDPLEELYAHHDRSRGKYDDEYKEKLGVLLVSRVKALEITDQAGDHFDIARWRDKDLVQNGLNTVLNIWKKNYFLPRTAPLDQEMYLLWAEHWLSKLPVESYYTYDYPIEQNIGFLALTDRRYP